MASLMEELISVLEQEDAIYRELIPIAEKKTRVIIDNDLAALEQITEREQESIQQITSLERKRQEVVTNMGTVINRNPATLDLKTLVNLLDKQPEDQRKLSLVADRLSKSIHRLVDVNNQNQQLIHQSMEMIDFNINLMKSAMSAPGNNYTKNASEAGAAVVNNASFDAKQ
ncbi:MAG: flagellar protein FlgN [Lachnospiraceae bacterium]|nr:flagellar protein FlgN [Lachnospiraceae bacterium]